MYPSYQQHSTTMQGGEAIHPHSSSSAAQSQSPMGVGQPLTPTASTTLDKVHGLMGCWNNNIL